MPLSWRLSRCKYVRAVNFPRVDGNVPVSSLPCVLLPSKPRALSRVSMPSEGGIVPVICLSGCPASEPKSKALSRVSFPNADGMLPPTWFLANATVTRRVWSPREGGMGVSGGGWESAKKCDEGGKVELVRCVHGQNGATGKEAYRHSGKACDAAMGGGRGPSDAQ